MTDILVRPAELRQISEQLKSSAKKIGTALQAIDSDILSLKRDKFLGNRANAVQSHYAPKREALLKAKEIVAHFAEDLQTAASNFERADKSGGATPTVPIAPSKPVSPPPDVKPITPPVSPPANPARVQQIKDLIHSMNVTGNSKYLPKNGSTYCNIFAMDFCKRMGIPLPEYLDWNKDGHIDDYLNANESISWLNGSYDKGGVQTGAQLGWKTVNADQAAQYASEGKVVVAGWTNPDARQPGHMAIVRPESTAGNIQIAQAGGTNFEKGAVTKGFGNRNVSYFVYTP